ncbi:MAG: OsmC family protein [Brumimicrobium sp.]|nr:OsmC family protein [Brumimicrobium sp.]
MNTITSVTKRENYETEVKSGSGHVLIIDEPESIGGKNKGMSPDEHIIAALAGCTSATLKMYAQRKEWDLQGVRTDIRIIHGEKPGILPTIERDIVLVGNLDEEQKARLLEIANKCPIHKLLTHEIQITSALVG